MSGQSQNGNPNIEPQTGLNEALPNETVSGSGESDNSAADANTGNGPATHDTSASAPKVEPVKRKRGRPKGSGARSGAKPSDDKAAQGENVTGTVIKKYANRRLYDTSASRYVTLEDLALMVREGTEFTVQDARTGEDITRSVLGQIIFEQEAKDGQSLLPTAFLRQVISYYGDQMGAVVPSYLEQSMAAFQEGQDEMRRQFASMMGGKPPDPRRMGHGMAELAAAPLKAIEEQTRRNAEAFTEAMRMFSPFGMGGMGRAGGGSSTTNRGGVQSGSDKQDAHSSSAETAASNGDGAKGSGDELAQLREQIAAMQRKVDRLGE